VHVITTPGRHIVVTDLMEQLHKIYQAACPAKLKNMPKVHQANVNMSLCLQPCLEVDDDTQHMPHKQQQVKRGIKLGKIKLDYVKKQVTELKGPDGRTGHYSIKLKKPTVAARSRRSAITDDDLKALGGFVVDGDLFHQVCSCSDWSLLWFLRGRDNCWWKSIHITPVLVFC